MKERLMDFSLEELRKYFKSKLESYYEKRPAKIKQEMIELGEEFGITSDEILELHVDAMMEVVEFQPHYSAISFLEIFDTAEPIFLAKLKELTEKKMQSDVAETSEIIDVWVKEGFLEESFDEKTGERQVRVILRPGETGEEWKKRAMERFPEDEIDEPEIKEG